MSLVESKVDIQNAVEGIQPYLNSFFREGRGNLMTISEFVDQYASVISSLIKALKLDMRAFPKLTKWSDTGNECFGIVDIAPLKPTPTHLRTLRVGVNLKMFDDVYARIGMVNHANIFVEYTKKHTKDILINNLFPSYQNPYSIASMLHKLARDHEKTLDGLNLLYGLRAYDVTEYEDLEHPYFDEAFHDYHKHYKTPLGDYEITFHADEFSPCGLPSFFEFEVKK
jgi:hypothetical protein